MEKEIFLQKIKEEKVEREKSERKNMFCTYIKTAS